LRQIYLRSYFRGYNWLMRYIHDVENHPQRDVIEERVKIINFFDKYGEEATREAFGKARSTVFLWKKRLREGGGRLSSLAPLSRAPKRKRKSKISPAVREFIKQYRIHHPGVGKETVKPELDKYCKERGLPIISESTIGRIIKELKDKWRNSCLKDYAFFSCSNW